MTKTNKPENRLLLPEYRIAGEDNYTVSGKDFCMVRDITASCECSTFDDAELLSTLSGIKLVHAMEILKKYRLHEIEEYLDSLFPNITEHQKKMIKSVFEFSRRIFTKTPDKQYIKSPSDIVPMLECEMRYLKKEVFVIVHLNVKNIMTRKEVISVGCLNSAIVHPREVFANAVKCSVSGIVLCHNHRRKNMLTYVFRHDILGTI